MLLEAVIREPSTSAKACVIWLHGLGADGYDFADIVPMLHLKDAPIRFVFPHAPQRAVTLNSGMMMPAWYDIVSLDRSGREDEKGLREAQSWVESLIQNQIDSGIDSTKIFLVGFSQGGATSVFTALRSLKPLAGCAVLSGYLPLQQVLSKELVNKQLSLFMAHGQWDTVVDFQFAKRSYDVLVQEGLDVSFHTYPMAHEVCQEEMTALGEWMVQRISL
jgi:phospholipase/carboxylesterase